MVLRSNRLRFKDPPKKTDGLPRKGNYSDNDDGETFMVQGAPIVQGVTS